MAKEYKYERGEKVIYIPDGDVFDFGYYSQTENTAIIYEEGECNMQDAFAAKLDKIRPVKDYDAPVNHWTVYMPTEEEIRVIDVVAGITRKKYDFSKMKFYERPSYIYFDEKWYRYDYDAYEPAYMWEVDSKKLIDKLNYLYRR